MCSKKCAKPDLPGLDFVARAGLHRDLQRHDVREPGRDDDDAAARWRACLGNRERQQLVRHVRSIRGDKCRCESRALRAPCVAARDWLSPPRMFMIDLTGKRALVAGVADDGGFGFAIAKALAEAGATVVRRHLAAGAQHLQEPARARQVRRVARARRAARSWRSSASIRSTPPTTRSPTCPRRCARTSATRTSATSPSTASPRGWSRDFGEQPLDIVVHSLANGPEVKKPLLETSRAGYLTARRRERLLAGLDGAAARPAACAPDGSFLSLTYMASERVIPGYGGGMSSAKAALESDTRVLAFEAGRKLRPPREHASRRARSPRARRAPSASSTR